MARDAPVGPFAPVDAAPFAVAVAHVAAISHPEQVVSAVHRGTEHDVVGVQ